MRGLSPVRRTALASVVAACGLIAVKLGFGLSTGSLGLVSEAIHSGTDLVAALLTFFAVGVAVRPADRSHPYGHGKAEHLSALGEAAVLVGASVFIAVEAVGRLADDEPPDVDVRWYLFLVLGLVVAVDLSRVIVSRRAARRYASPALEASAVHFLSDLAATTAVAAGLLGVRAGFADADSIAALAVAVLVLMAAARLIRRNVDVLMDRVPDDAHARVREAIESLGPEVVLRRLRMRQAAGRHFADVVIAVAPGSPVAQGHALADAVEDTVERALPGSDVVVHVEPVEGDPTAALRERVLAAAAAVPRVREVHNVGVIRVGELTEAALHLKLPGDLALREAHEIASAVESAIRGAVPEVDVVRTHLEPLAEEARGQSPAASVTGATVSAIASIVQAELGRPPREVRIVATGDRLLVFLTLALGGSVTLAEAHAAASRVEDRIRHLHHDVADVVVHTEP